VSQEHDRSRQLVRIRSVPTGEHLLEQPTQLEKILEQERFANEARGAECGSFLAILLRIGRRQDHYGYCGASPAGSNAVQNFVSRSSGQVQIEDDQIRAAHALGVNLIDEPDRLLAIRDDGDSAVDAVLGKRFAYETDVTRVILDEQNTRRVP
jgi:hypothetical protein